MRARLPTGDALRRHRGQHRWRTPGEYWPRKLPGLRTGHPSSCLIQTSLAFPKSRRPSSPGRTRRWFGLCPGVPHDHRDYRWRCFRWDLPGGHQRRARPPELNGGPAGRGPGGPGPARGRPTPGRRRRHFCFRVDWRAQAVRATPAPLPLGTRSGAESRRSRPLWAVWALGLNRIPGVATVLLEPCLRPQSAHAAFAGLGVATVLQQARCVASPKRCPCHGSDRSRREHPRPCGSRRRWRNGPRIDQAVHGQTPHRPPSPPRRSPATSAPSIAPTRLVGAL